MVTTIVTGSHAGLRSLKREAGNTHTDGIKPKHSHKVPRLDSVVPENSVENSQHCDIDIEEEASTSTQKELEEVGGSLDEESEMIVDDNSIKDNDKRIIFQL